MKEFFFFLLDNVFYIFFALFIILIFTLFSNNKKENKKFKNGVIEVLDKKAIIKSLNVYKSLGIVSIVSLMFIPVGILIFYLAFSQTNSVGNIILLVIFGLILICLPLFIICLLVKDGLLIRMGKYVIVEDTLLDVEVVYSNSDTGRSMDGYYFYFKDYFKKYNEVVKVGQNNFYNSKENDEFYLVFINGNKSPYVFSKRRYLLSDDDREKLVSIESLKDYVKKLQEFSYKKVIKV